MFKVTITQIDESEDEENDKTYTGIILLDNRYYSVSGIDNYSEMIKIIDNIQFE